MVNTKIVAATLAGAMAIATAMPVDRQFLDKSGLAVPAPKQKNAHAPSKNQMGDAREMPHRLAPAGEVQKEHAPLLGHTSAGPALRGAPRSDINRAGRRMTPRDIKSDAWEIIRDSVKPRDPMTIKLMLKTDREALARKVAAISTPGSPEFRKYITQEQIRDIVGVPADTLNRIKHFLEAAGARDVTFGIHADWVSALGDARLIEAIFNCELALYRHRATGNSKVRAVGDYTIPGELSDVVELVSGLHTLPLMRWGATDAAAAFERSMVTVDAVTPQDITPAVVTSTYGLVQPQAGDKVMGAQATVQFGSIGNYAANDLEAFYQSYAPGMSGFTISMIYGTNNAIESTETILDDEYMTTTAPFVPTGNYKIPSGNDITEAFLDYTEIVLGQSNPPLVHSISYGSYAAPYDNSTEQALEYQVQKMAARGITVVLASGDNGVGCNSDGTSQEYDFPSAPSITMVGATYLAPSGEEIGATLSSGGFSPDYWRPSWQASAVDAYLANPDVTLPAGEFFAREGRAYPDISAFGQQVVICKGSKGTTCSQMTVSGTSCSAPMIGAVFSLINNELMQAGLAPLGAVNPFLYAHPEAFTDVVQGNNAYKRCKGFDASKGWDPVTGLGTPLYEALRDAAFKDAQA